MPGVLGLRANADSFNKSIRAQPLEKSICILISLLKANQISGPRACAIATANILSHALYKSKAPDFDSLRVEIAGIGTRLVRANPKEPVIANITRRVLGLITDEAEEDRNGDDGDITTEPLTPSEFDGPPPSTAQNLASSASKLAEPRPVAALRTLSSFSAVKTRSLLHLLSDEPLVEDVPSGTSSPLGSFSINMNMHGLRTEVVEGIEEIKDEIAQVDSQIAAKAEQISPGESILVYRPSGTVRGFLAKAAARRKFAVFQLFYSQDDKPEDYKDFRNDLVKHGVEVINVYGSASTIMSRLTRVVLDGLAVFANGAVIVDAGGANIAHVAEGYGKAVTVLSGVYRFSPEIVDDPERFVTWAEETPRGFSGEDKAVPVMMALTETIPGRQVKEYITNLGVSSFSSIHRIINDHYKPEDQDFVQWVDGSAL